MTDMTEVEDYLAHHGIKGMRWGVRRDAPSGVGPGVAARAVLEPADHTLSVHRGARPSEGQQFHLGGVNHTIVRVASKDRQTHIVTSRPTNNIARSDNAKKAVQTNIVASAEAKRFMEKGRQYIDNHPKAAAWATFAVTAAVVGVTRNPEALRVLGQGGKFVGDYLQSHTNLSLPHISANDIRGRLGLPTSPNSNNPFDNLPKTRNGPMFNPNAKLDTSRMQERGAGG